MNTQSKSDVSMKQTKENNSGQENRIITGFSRQQHNCRSSMHEHWDTWPTTHYLLEAFTKITQFQLRQKKEENQKNYEATKKDKVTKNYPTSHNDHAMSNYERRYRFKNRAILRRHRRRWIVVDGRIIATSPIVPLRRTAAKFC